MTSTKISHARPAFPLTISVSGSMAFASKVATLVLLLAAVALCEAQASAVPALLAEPTCAFGLGTTEECLHHGTCTNTGALGSNANLSTHLMS